MPIKRSERSMERWPGKPGPKEMSVWCRAPRRNHQECSGKCGCKCHKPLPVFGPQLQRWPGNNRLKRPLIDRFMDSFDVSPCGCWEWRALKNANGYGIFYTGARSGTLAHRFSYEHFVGPIPNGLCLDHLCRNRACINPSHLEAVTLEVNLARGFSPPAIYGRATHCKRGHLMVKSKHGYRKCKECGNARARRKYYEKKGVEIE